MTDQIRELNLNDLDAVTGGGFLLELGKAALGWAVGKVLEGGGGTTTHPVKVAENLVKWQQSLK